MSSKLCRHRVQSVRPGIAGSARTWGEGHLRTIPAVRISEAYGKRQIWALGNAPLPSEYDGGTQRRDKLRHRAAVRCRSLAARVMGELPNRVCLRLYLWQLRAQGIRRRSIRVAASRRRKAPTSRSVPRIYRLANCEWLLLLQLQRRNPPVVGGCSAQPEPRSDEHTSKVRAAIRATWRGPRSQPCLLVDSQLRPS